MAPAVLAAGAQRMRHNFTPTHQQQNRQETCTTRRTLLQFYLVGGVFRDVFCCYCLACIQRAWGLIANVCANVCTKIARQGCESLGRYLGKKSILCGGRNAGEVKKRALAPGSLPGLRRGTNGTLRASARGAPKIRPRASKPDVGWYVGCCWLVCVEQAYQQRRRHGCPCSAPPARRCTSGRHQAPAAASICHKT